MSSIVGKQLLSHKAKVRASLVICTVSPEPSLFAHINSWPWGTFSQRTCSCKLEHWFTYVQSEGSTQSGGFRNYFEKHHAFKSEVLKGNHGKTAQFCARYMNISLMALILGYKENNLELHVTALYALCPIFFAYVHTNYAKYIPVYLITLLNLSDTHPRCKEFLGKCV